MDQMPEDVPSPQPLKAPLKISSKSCLFSVSNVCGVALFLSLIFLPLKLVSKESAVVGIS